MPGNNDAAPEKEFRVFQKPVATDNVRFLAIRYHDVMQSLAAQYLGRHQRTLTNSPKGASGRPVDDPTHDTANHEGKRRGIGMRLQDLLPAIGKAFTHLRRGRVEVLPSLL